MARKKRLDQGKANADANDDFSDLEESGSGPRKVSFMQRVKPSPALAALIGAEPQRRTEVISRLWVYIKQHKLEDATDPRLINTDAGLRAVFGGKRQVDMEELIQLVFHHLEECPPVPLATERPALPSPLRQLDDDEPDDVALGGFRVKLQPDQPLAKIVGAAPITRAEVIRRLWDYIKLHGLQDLQDKRHIKADARLLPLFGGRKRVDMFELVKLVNRHLSPAK